MSLSPWLDRPYTPGPRLFGRHTADALVIGAGMTGIGLAYSLRGRGLRTIVLERGTVAGGASGRNAGFLVTGLGEHYARSIEFWGRESAAAISRLHLQNQAWVAEVVARHEIACDYAGDGSFVIAADLPEENLLRQSRLLMLEDGFPCEFVEEAVLNNTLGTCGFGGGLFNPMDGRVDPVSLIRGLAAVVRSDGCAIFERTPVNCIRKDGGSWLLETEQGSAASPLLFLASNAWTHLLVPGLSCEPVRGQCLDVGPLERPANPVPCYTNYGSEYWRGIGHSVIIGGMRRSGLQAECTDEDEVTEPVQQALERFRDEHFPYLRGVPVIHRWSGIMSYSDDGLPLVGEVPGCEGILLAAGYTGHGFGWAFLAARWLVRMALDGIDEIPALCRIDRKMRSSPALKEI